MFSNIFHLITWRSRCLSLMVLRMERTFFLAPPTSSKFSASWSEMIHASPSIDVELCLFCNATLSLLSRSNPSIFTWNQTLEWRHWFRWQQNNCEMGNSYDAWLKYAICLVKLARSEKLVWSADDHTNGKIGRVREIGMISGWSVDDYSWL